MEALNETSFVSDNGEMCKHDNQYKALKNASNNGVIVRPQSASAGTRKVTWAEVAPNGGSFQNQKTKGRPKSAGNIRLHSSDRDFRKSRQTENVLDKDEEIKNTEDTTNQTKIEPDQNISITASNVKLNFTKMDISTRADKQKLLMHRRSTVPFETFRSRRTSTLATRRRSMGRAASVGSYDLTNRGPRPRDQRINVTVDLMKHLSRWRKLASRSLHDKQEKRNIALLMKKLRLYCQCIRAFIVLYRQVRESHSECATYCEQLNLSVGPGSVGIVRGYHKFFDPTEYKANTQMKMSSEGKRILQKQPADRTDEEVEYATIALRNIKLVADYPLNMQRSLARYGRFVCYNGGRLLLQQGHQPWCAYVIFHGTAVVCVEYEDRVRAQTKCYLYRGDNFGELSIVECTVRQSTVISREYIELLAIEKQDYENIFLIGGSKNLSDPDHNEFMRSLYFLREWPIERLTNNPKIYLFNFFRRDCVMVRDSKNSKWIYVVKSGSVRVLKRLRNTHPLTIDPHTGRCTKRLKSGGNDPFLKTMPKQDTWNKSVSKTSCKRSKCNEHKTQSKVTADPHERRTLESDLEGSPHEEDTDLIRDPVFVHIQTLTRGDAFGIGPLLFVDQPSLCLVSNGAECVLLNKQFYKQNCSYELLRDLKLEVSPYPSDSQLQDDLSIRVNWDAYKQATLNQLYHT